MGSTQQQPTSGGDAQSSGPAPQTADAQPFEQQTMTTSSSSSHHHGGHHGGPHQIGALGQSVVPDLMRVYESLTQSSTPQQAPAPAPAVQQQPQQQQQAQVGHPGTYYQEQQHPQQQNEQYRYAPAPAPTNEQPSEVQPQANYQENQPQPQQPYYAPQQQNQYSEYQQPSAQQQHVQYSEYQQQQQQIAQQISSMPPPLPASTQDDFLPAQPPVTPAPAAPAPTRASSRKRRLSESASDSSAPSAPTGRSGRSGRSRKKKSNSDGRWSKRFQWPDELHRDFVAAVFDVGLKHSSPSAILEYMPPNESITSERVKSHLQKYRLHRARSKREFMASYDAAAGKFRQNCEEGYLIDPVEVSALTSGEVAAHLSCVATNDDSSVPGPVASASPPPAAAVGGAQAPAPTAGAAQAQSQPAGGALHLPQLSEEEKRSPIGASMGYLMGLFFALQQQLAQQRAAQAASGGGVAPPIGAPAPAPVTVPATNPAGQGFGSYVNPPPAAAAAQPTTYASAPEQQPQQQLAHAQMQPAASSSSAPMSGGHVRQQPPTSTSSSTILEENNMMKRDMKAQMALQNQMRALKNKEVAKYKSVGLPKDATAQGQGHLKSDVPDQNAQPGKTPDPLVEGGVSQGVGETSNGTGGEDADAAATATAGAHGPAEGGTVMSPEQKARNMSFSEDFWNTAVEDEQLFEFLMS